MLSENQLLSILQAEEHDSVGYYNSEIAYAQEEALDRYYGLLFGDEIEGRSQVVSRDVAEVIDWLLPDLMRVFFSGDQVAHFEAQTSADEAFVDEAEDYANFVFTRDNDGFRIVHDWLKDGMLQKLGVMDVEWRDPEKQPPETLTGYNTQKLLALKSDPKVEITEYEESAVRPSEDYPDGLSYTLTVVREDEGRILISNRMPEEVLVSRRTHKIDQLDYDGARYVASRRRMALSELLEMFPDDKEKIDGLAKGEDEELDTRTTNRFKDEDYDTDYGEDPSDESMREIVFLDEYVRVDYDEDGIAELRNIKRVDGTIFYNEQVDDNPFVDWCPVPMPHKLYGLSVADQVTDLQKIKSVLWRAAMDSTLLAVNPRVAYNDDPGKGPIANRDDLLNVVPGGAVRTSGDPASAMMPLVTPDVSAPAFQMLEYADREREERSGVTRQGSGLDPDVLSKQVAGITFDMVSGAGAIRKEMYARFAARGLEKLFTKILRLLIKHQQSERIIKLRNGEWKPVDPRKWNPSMRAQVHVGLNVARREAQLTLLDRVLQEQKEIFAIAGPDNTVSGVKEVVNTLRKMVEIAGFRDADAFFGKPEEGMSLPQQENPEVAKVREEAMLKREEMRLEHERKMIQLTIESQMAAQQANAELNLEATIAKAKMLIEGVKVDADIGLKSRVQLGGEVG